MHHATRSASCNTLVIAHDSLDGSLESNRTYHPDSRQSALLRAVDAVVNIFCHSSFEVPRRVMRNQRFSLYAPRFHRPNFKSNESIQETTNVVKQKNKKGRISQKAPLCVNVNLKTSRNLKYFSQRSFSTQKVKGITFLPLKHTRPPPHRTARVIRSSERLNHQHAHPWSKHVPGIPQFQPIFQHARRSYTKQTV